MPEPFEITEVNRSDAIGHLRVKGRLDAKSASTLTGRCGAFRASGRDLVLNLSDVSFMASSGLGALLSMTEEFRQAGCGLRLANPSPAVLSVIQLLNLDQFLTIDSSDEDAIHALQT